MPDVTALFVIDPPERLDPLTDTSLALMRESLRRGLRVVYCTLGDLRLEDGHPLAWVRPVAFEAGAEMFRVGPLEETALDDLAVLHMRKDPPVDAAYLQACAILDRLPAEVLQVNPVRALRLHGEKMIPLLFPGLPPATLVTSAPADLAAFLERYGKIVIKPLEDCSGRGIFLLERGQRELDRLLAEATQNGRRFVQGQEFLSESAEGDKRVLLLGGEILGWVQRVPATGEFRSNINAGGRCIPCELTAADRAICRRLQPWLLAEQIHFAGADIVGGRLLEVNITSPSCLREINQFSGAALEEKIIEYVLANCRSC